MIGHHQGDRVTCNGTIVAALAGSFFRVQLDGGLIATVRPSGRMRLGRVAVVPGDQVVCEFFVGCFETGRLVHRFDGDGGTVIKPKRRRKARKGKARMEFAAQMDGDSL